MTSDTCTSAAGNAGDSSPSMRTLLCDRCTLQEQFDITEEFGFAAGSPLAVLPEYFQPWNDIALNMQELIKQKKVRSEVKNLPLLDHNRLETKAEWEAAHMFLAYITQGYVWQDGEEGIPEVLPKAIAIPFYAVSERLGIPPNFNQFNSVLVNWKWKDGREQAYCQENLETVLTLAGGREEQWFFLTALMVEMECCAALYAIADAQQAVYNQDDVKLEAALTVIEGAVRKMANQLKRMDEGLTPDMFYNVIRRFISGWTGPAFKARGLEGLIYEGVSDTPLAYPGGTAAESTTLPALDAALGIGHNDSEEILLKNFKKYMPPKHVAFVSAVSRGPSIRNYVKSREGSDVHQAYDRCLEGIQHFRNMHIQLVTRFIVIPSRKGTHGGMNGTIGTGGTGFMSFLRGLRDSTVRAHIGSSSSNQKSSLASRTALLSAVGVGVVVLTAILYRKMR